MIYQKIPKPPVPVQVPRGPPRSRPNSAVPPIFGRHVFLSGYLRILSTRSLIWSFWTSIQNHQIMALKSLYMHSTCRRDRSEDSRSQNHQMMSLFAWYYASGSISARRGPPDHWHMPNSHSVIGTNWLLRGDSDKREGSEDESIMSRS